jgi:hypothetical protein
MAIPVGVPLLDHFAALSDPHQHAKVLYWVVASFVGVRRAKPLARRRRILRTPTIKLVTGTRISARPPVRRGGVSPSRNGRAVR